MYDEVDREARADWLEFDATEPPDVPTESELRDELTDEEGFEKDEETYWRDLA